MTGVATNLFFVTELQYFTEFVDSMCDFIRYLALIQLENKVGPPAEKFSKKYLEIDKTFNFGAFNATKP